MIVFGSGLGSLGPTLDPNIMNFKPGPVRGKLKLSKEKSLSRTMLK